MGSRKYVLISSAYNEARNILKTIESVIQQSSIPSEWILLSDGSNDGTDDIIKRYSESIDFIRFARMERAATHSFGSKVRAINHGLASLSVSDFDYLGILDTDISFKRDYFSSLLDEFDRDERLGVAGGNIVQDIDGRLVRRIRSMNSVAGAVQFFRRACFEATTGFQPMEFGGEDAAVEIMARMKGWTVKTIPRSRGDSLRLCREKFGEQNDGPL